MKWDNIKACLIPAIALMLIAGVVTAALAGVDLLTKDTIAKRAEEQENAARRQVIQADSFTEKTLSADGTDTVYCEAYRDNALVGYVFTVTTSGKSAGLTVMTGIAVSGDITGIAVTASNETAGYVDKVIADGLFDRIQKANGTAVDVTSNATRTSKGILNGVEQAKTYYSQVTKEVAMP